MCYPNLCRKRKGPNNKFNKGWSRVSPTQPLYRPVLKLVSVCCSQVFIPLNRVGGFTFSRVNPWLSKVSLVSRANEVEPVPGADIKFLLRTQTNVTSNHRNNPWEFFTECAKIFKCNSSGNLRAKIIALFNFFSIFFLKNDQYSLHMERAG